MTSAMAVTTDLDALIFRGTTLRRSLGDAVTAADIDMSTEQVTQLDVTMEDPYFAILNRGLLDNGIYVDYHELRMLIAATETGGGVAGVGGVKVSARPVVVTKLKNRTGKLVMKNLSPSQFVASECRAIKAKCVVQPSARRKLISRDVPDKANAGASNGEKPSSWTTFRRLAGELGFLLFEVAGVIYFGTPAWLAAHGGRVYVSWRYGDLKYRVDSPPVCRRSVDDAGNVTVTVDVPARRAAEFRPGKVLVLAGVPRFNGGYFITQVSYSLLNMEGTISVTASTPMNLLTQRATPITTNIAFPRTITQGLTANTYSQPVPTITEPRVGTKSRRDMVYWIVQGLFDTYETMDDKEATAYNDEDGLTGVDLLNYGLLQVGLSPYESMESLEAACKAKGTVVSLKDVSIGPAALRTPGAVLFAENYIAIVTHIPNLTIEPRNRQYVAIDNRLSLSRFRAAYLLPGMVP